MLAITHNQVLLSEWSRIRANNERRLSNSIYVLSGTVDLSYGIPP